LDRFFPGKIILLSLTLITALSILSYSLSTERMINRPVDIMGAGGVGVTAYDKFGMFTMNPATFAVNEKGTFSILKLGALANFDLISYYNLFNALTAAGGDITKLTAAQMAQLLSVSANVGMTGPLGLGYISDNMGMLLYDNFLTSATIRRGAGLPYVDFGTYLEFGLTVGYGFKLPVPVFLGKFTRAYGGITVKYLNRFKYENRRMSMLELLDFTDSLLTFKKGFLWGQAIGSDMGLLVKDESLAFGLVVRDWFTTQFSWSEYSAQFQPIASTNAPTYFAPSCDVGVSYRIKNLISRYMLTDLTVSLDLVNAFDFTEYYLLKVRLGLEFSAFSVLRFRTGIYKGYPTFGVGLVFPLITINAAYYTEELGDLPGTIPQTVIIGEIQLIL
jgi:hypothetical protein